jgi:hypothetical protein
MRSHRVLIPLLAAVLVLQGMVAVAPHQHGPARPETPEINEFVPSQETHQCLACAVHVPLIEPATGSGFIPVTTVVSAATSVGPDDVTVAEPSPFGPRGPPSA